MSESIRLPEENRVGHRYVLHEEIPALQLVATENGHARWGPLIRLPRGAELDELGEGFDKRTVMVRFGPCYYIVFQQDLATSPKSATSHKRAHAGN